MISLASIFTHKNKKRLEQSLRSLDGAAMTGDLSSIEANNVFQFFEYAGSSGHLVFLSEKNSADFFLENGALIYGHLQCTTKPIGTMLVESGALTREQLDQCLDSYRKVKRKERLGEVIVKKGFIDDTRLDETLKLQIKEAFFAVLSWHHGVFHFFAKQRPAPGEVLTNERIDHLLLEGIVRIENATS